jgi:hypothetical protein
MELRYWAGCPSAPRLSCIELDRTTRVFSGNLSSEPVGTLVYPVVEEDLNGARDGD